MLITTDQHELILDYQRLDSWPEVGAAIPLADRLLSRYGEGLIASLSFDKGFSRQEDRELLELYIPQVIMPKRGKRNRREEERENQKSFRALRNRHQAIESDINCLEHHGLNRCLDKGLDGFERYVGFGVLSYNLHKIGARLLQRQREGQARKPRCRPPPEKGAFRNNKRFCKEICVSGFCFWFCFSVVTLRVAR